MCLYGIRELVSDLISYFEWSSLVQVNTYPWMAALGSKTAEGSVTWFCGGSYIGNNLILTAAHCIPTSG